VLETKQLNYQSSNIRTILEGLWEKSIIGSVMGIIELFRQVIPMQKNIIEANTAQGLLDTNLVYPEQIDIMVNAGCNAKCAFCVQEATYKPDSVDDHQFLAALERHFKDFYYHGGRKVVITGGEPLLYMSRVLAVLEVISRYPDLQIKALYTNASQLLNEWDGITVANALKIAGLGCVNMSVHHYEHVQNNSIFGLPNKASTESIAIHLRELGLPFRFNLVLQNGGIDTIEKFMQYVNWCLKLGAKDIYIRELFEFAFNKLISKTDRDPINYSHDNHISAKPIIEKLLANSDVFQPLGVKHEEFRDKSEYEFIHLPTNKHIYISQLVIGTEDKKKVPYLVVMPDSQLYKGWLGSNDLI
jgi:molybdenum cofactor biosynthesis enzyme MoaA